MCVRSLPRLQREARAGGCLTAELLNYSFAPSHLHRPQHSARFVFRLFELAPGIRIGDDAGSCLQVGFLALHQQSPDYDAGIKISREVGVENGTAVYASSRRFQFFDDLHGSDFGCAAERSRGKARREGVDGIEFWT